MINLKILKEKFRYSKHLGYFKNKIDAVKARKDAQIKYNFHKNHGGIENV